MVANSKAQCLNDARRLTMEHRCSSRSWPADRAEERRRAACPDRDGYELFRYATSPV